MQISQFNHQPAKLLMQLQVFFALKCDLYLCQSNKQGCLLPWLRDKNPDLTQMCPESVT